MGLVYADIELINADDVALARKHIIGEEEIKKIHINMLADSGAYMMAINENIQTFKNYTPKNAAKEHATTINLLFFQTSYFCIPSNCPALLM